MPTTYRGILDFRQDPEYIAQELELRRAGWTVGRMSIMAHGTEVTVRPVAGGPAAGSAERTAVGRDEADAVRSVLKQIKAEQGGGGS